MTPVYAACGGRTSGCVYRTAGGRGLWITHPSGLMVYYAHLEWLTVLGQEDVYRGQLVAFSGNTGKHTTGAHLHFACKIHGKWVDPLPLLES